MVFKNDTESYFHYLDLHKEVQSLIAELACQSKTNPSYKHIWQVYQKTIEFERNQRETSAMLYDTLPQTVTELADPAGQSQTLLNDRDGILMAQKASNAYESINNLIKQARQIGVRGSSDATTDAERTVLQTELVSIKAEIDRIIAATTYNGAAIIGLTGKKIQVGPFKSANDSVEIAFAAPTSDDIKVDAITTDKFKDLLSACDTMKAAVDTAEGKTGDIINRLNVASQKSKEDIYSVAKSLENSLRGVAAYYRQMAQFYFAICPKKDIPSSL